MQSVLKTHFLAAPFKQADFVQKLDYFSFPKQFKVHSPNSPPTAGCCGQPCMHVCRSLTHSLHSDVKYPPLSTRHPLPRTPLPQTSQNVVEQRRSELLARFQQGAKSRTLCLTGAKSQSFVFTFEMVRGSPCSSPPFRVKPHGAPPCN